MSANTVSIGTVASDASTRGVTSTLTGLTPIDCSASICSVTTIEPSDAVIAAPARPANTIPVSIGPSSRTSPNATDPPTNCDRPYETADEAASNDITSPVKSEVSTTIGHDCTPRKYA